MLHFHLVKYARNKAMPYDPETIQLVEKKIAQLDQTP
ncbi:MAG: hypothetical protein UV59_C0012G0013 [Candidatus Gottesmanbacteria bacterium GW2011_GWA1_43_11]|uniref:Uncharacterized protein n=1 Tax=Candidatus Gottesmanbacteria bacterium GW2011_GWA1_43_11 TaxID=1618436 RepID=A0A0G1CGH4_9BACT|nr:MAG: hypothetical protein UV59_C0012G0013 [Candidatus Gottesmanbacteria bacterium GW2011_GWA1_43_11]